MKWRGYCDSYVTSPTEEATGKASRAPRGTSQSVSRLIHTKKAPLMIIDPNVNTVHFDNDEQKAYFDEWAFLSVTYLSGGLTHTRLWTTTMPQVTLQETILRYGAMAIGALRRAYIEEGQSAGTTLRSNNTHYLNAIIYYCEALRMQSHAKPSRESLRTALLSSLLFICFETQRANMPSALKHIQAGFGMLNELAACSNKAPDLVSMAPAPPVLVEEILDCYKPLELQSRSFIGSFQKFFFPPGARQPESPERAAAAAAAQTAGHMPGSGNLAQVQSAYVQQRPQIQNQPHWHSRSPTPSDRGSDTGLPSPQSQASPQASHMVLAHHQRRQQQPSASASASASASPSPQAGSPTPPRRPPGILPFTQNSPYFRPKHSHIKSLEEIPRVFCNFDEAQGYWTLIQKQMVQYLPILVALTSQLSLPKINDLAELERRFSSVRQNPKISKFVAESRYWLQRWIEAFDPLFTSVAHESQDKPQPYLQAAHLRIEYLTLYIYTAIPRYSGLFTAKGLTPQYREINMLAETLLRARPICGFAMDSGWTWPLFVSAFACRDDTVRDDAIRILGQYPIRNALRDSRVFRAIALRNREVDQVTAMHESDEQARWLQQRRREVVFEDFGTNIIYRYSQLDEATGQWVMVEEAADFMVQEDGTLPWQRQPLTNSASILSGVC
jgi:hypothetical protein